MDYLVCTLLTGVGATAVMGLSAIARKRLLGILSPNYGLEGRWLAHMPRGRFRHDSIAAAQAVRGEYLIGWTAPCLRQASEPRYARDLRPRPLCSGLGYQPLVRAVNCGISHGAARRAVGSPSRWSPDRLRVARYLGAG